MPVLRETDAPHLHKCVYSDPANRRKRPLLGGWSRPVYQSQFHLDESLDEPVRFLSDVRRVFQFLFVGPLGFLDEHLELGHRHSAYHLSLALRDVGRHVRKQLLAHQCCTTDYRFDDDKLIPLDGVTTVVKIIDKSEALMHWAFYLRRNVPVINH